MKSKEQMEAEIAQMHFKKQIENGYDPVLKLIKPHPVTQNGQPH